MAQRDYILRMFEEMSRALAQIVYHRQIKDYQAAHDLIDEQFKQTLGMGGGFIRLLPDEMLLALLSTLGTLNVEKCWLVAALLKAEGELYAEEQDENNSYCSYLKSCNLFLEVLYKQNQGKDIEKVAEIEELLRRLENYELPLRTQQLLFWYFEYTGRYDRAENTLFDILATETGEETESAAEEEALVEKGELFYVHLSGKSDEILEAGSFSRDAISEGLARLRKRVV